MAKERPSVEEMKEMAMEEGMTFAKMGRILQVDRKTAKRWCLDAGITQVGKNILKPQNDDALPMIDEPLPETEVISRDKGPDITSIAKKVSTGNFDQLDEKEKVAFNALAEIARAALAKAIGIIHERTDNHYHTVLTPSQGKKYMSEQRHLKAAGDNEAVGG